MANAKEEDVFKEHFKRFKKITSINKSSSVIDFSKVEELPNEVEKVDIKNSSDIDNSSILGLVPPSQWKAYKLKSKPGFVYIQNPFMPGYQHQWIVKCLTSYPLLPNVCNLDSHIKRAGLGEVWPPGLNQSSSTDIKSSLLYKLRWVTLGYHYDWTSKRYDPAHFSPFPSDLACLSKYVLSVIGYNQFTAEAAIVNYYHMDSTLSGHTDHSEINLDAPLISISFGQSAIFLIGGKTKQEVPTALLLNSGDIVVMGGTSRLGYHAVPRVLHSSTQDSIPPCLYTSTFREALKHYEDCKTGNGCSLCGRNLCDLARHGNVTSDTRKRPPPHTDDDELHHLSKAIALSSTEKGLETDLTDEHDQLKAIESKDCIECQWILGNWEQLKLYLNSTRININIRQVGFIDD